MNLDVFKDEVSKLGIKYTDDMLEKLEKYYELLISYNEKMNLTAITEKEDVYLKHFYDSLTIVKVIDLNSINSVCDIGTGAGFPGIVLKIFFPNIELTLVDALNKRINFLETTVLKLNLTNVTCVHARAEEYALKNREKFDLVTARAVASLPVLLEYCLPLVKVSGYFVAMKGSEDISLAGNALNKLSGEIDINNKFLLPFENSNRTLIRVKKINKTDKKFPRKFSEIKKRPL